VKFGNFELATINVLKYEDLDRNADRDILVEPVIEGWTIYLYKVTEGPTYTYEGKISTGFDGSATFGDLGPGNYLVCEAAQLSSTYSSWVQTEPDTSSAKCADADAQDLLHDGLAPEGYEITVTSGETFPETGYYEFGNFQTPESQLTDTSFCALPGDQFRLQYLQSAPSSYRLNNSNPGQFYYNVWYAGVAGDEFTMEIDIPYPFVTNGAVPIQVHGVFTTDENDCYVPGHSLNADFEILNDFLDPTPSPSGNPIITLDYYGDEVVINPENQTTIYISGTVPVSGLVYVTVHLEYGLMRTEDWTPNLDTNNANNNSIGTIIEEGQPYKFSFIAENSIDDSDTQNPTSINIFKKVPGTGGTVLTEGTMFPMPGVQVQLYDPESLLIGYAETDEDGFYMIIYKHKGKRATYNVVLPDLDLSQEISLKGNGFDIANFEVP
jgi:hypothetical protein